MPSNSITTKISKLKYLIIFAFFIFSCSTAEESNKDEKKEIKTDSAAPIVEKNWIDIQSSISKLDSTTNYEAIIRELGKPYEEYPTPSLKDEYVLFYDVPGVNGAFFWIMLDTETKKFLYWSGEKNEK